MGRYITTSDAYARYRELININSVTNLDSHHIYYAEIELDSMLSRCYTVPFSSNNITAKDLAIDLTYLRSANFKFEDREKFRVQIMQKINELCSGQSSMILTDGTSTATVGGTIWSNTEDYRNTFSVIDNEMTHIDSSQQWNETQDRLNS